MLHPYLQAERVTRLGLSTIGKTPSTNLCQLQVPPQPLFSRVDYYISILLVCLPVKVERNLEAVIHFLDNLELGFWVRQCLAKVVY